MLIYLSIFSHHVLVDVIIIGIILIFCYILKRWCDVLRLVPTYLNVDDLSEMSNYNLRPELHKAVQMISITIPKRDRCATAKEEAIRYTTVNGKHVYLST